MPTPAPTIFNRLEDAGISWKVYFDEMQLVSLTGVQHAPSLEQYWRTEHFGHMSEFYEDAKAGKLPAYAFIEPRMVYNHNDFHPPFGVFRSSAMWTVRRSSTRPSPMFARARSSWRACTTPSSPAPRRTARTR